MGASFKVDLKPLNRIIRTLENPALEAKLRDAINQDTVLASVAQAISDNFAQEGPGWQPLQGETIRGSISKDLRQKYERKFKRDLVLSAKRKIQSDTNLSGKQKKEAKAAFMEMLAKNPRDLGKYRQFTFHNKKLAKFLEKKDQTSRANGGTPDRRILQRTGLMKALVTTRNPNVSMSRTEVDEEGNPVKSGKVVSGNNITRRQGFTLTYGTNLVYAAAHNYGYEQIPEREFLVLHEEWKERINNYFVEYCSRILNRVLGDNK